MILPDPATFWILIVWLTATGACIGSFLNVVVYRLPLGKSLSDPPSHCPKCGHPIRWYDNVPVFGWLFLQGKCRDCREPISPRYPIIEAICGGVFGSIAFMLLRREGDASFQEFLCLTVALSALVVTLLAAGLIELDGQKIPWKLFVPAALMGPMVPYILQYGFHYLWTTIPASGAEHAKTFGNEIPISFVVFCLFFSMIAGIISFCIIYFVSMNLVIPLKLKLFPWIIAVGLLGLYFGFPAFPLILFLTTPMILFCRLCHEKVKPFIVLTLTTFVFILITLAQSPASTLFD